MTKKANQDKAQNTKHTHEQAAAGNIGSVDDIRDILFGQQMHDYDKKFTRLEDLLTKKLMDMREESRKRLDSLEHYIKNELESLDDRLKAERKERLETDNHLENKLKTTAETFDQKTSDLQDMVIKTEKTLRSEILDQSKSLRDESQSSHDDLTKTLHSISDELRAQKVDRSQLATLLNKMAISLSQEPGGSRETS